MNKHIKNIRLGFLMQLFAIIAGSLIVIGCFSPYAGETGSISISFGESSRAAAWPDGPVNNILPYIDHHITLTNTSSGTTIERSVKGSATVRFQVVPGKYEVIVEDYCYDEYFAFGTSEAPIEVKAGQSTVAPIVMWPESGVTFHTINNGDWSGTLNTLFSGAATGYHYVIVTQDITLSTSILSL